jgi:hypothetical protein
VNALSNFVADPVNVLGFDPWARFVDYLVRRAGTGNREQGTDSPNQNGHWSHGSPFPVPGSQPVEAGV